MASRGAGSGIGRGVVAAELGFVSASWVVMALVRMRTGSFALPPDASRARGGGDGGAGGGEGGVLCKGAMLVFMDTDCPSDGPEFGRGAIG